ncbi:MAG: segregation/condensation protein A [Ktedonobacteraceae bacterium]|nr:segregation/condensation protein A [Ktedonobacteraceae bacterium]
MPEPVGTSEEVAVQPENERYVVHLPIFEGPLDLLLHLIEKRQMEITTISLVAVTDQYLAYLQRWQEDQLPLANMAAFVAIAARLLYIKSQSLLPHSMKEESDTQASNAAALADELQRHLVEYRIAKEIANVLRQHEEAGWQTHARSGLLAGIEAQLAWTPPTLSHMEVQSLAHAFQRLLELRARDEENGAQILPVTRVRVSERIAEIISRLQEKPAISLAEIIEHEHSRLVIIVTFIALLELWKWERISVKQEALMGPITLERGPRWSQDDQLTYDED